LRRGDIYLVSLDPTEGHEQRGTRPVVIVSSDVFNRASNVPIILPITSGGNFARAAGLSVSLMGLGTQTVGIVRCDQPRAIDLSARKARRIESLPAAVVDEIIGKLTSILD
jgi:mRNA interferase ChpB